LNLFCMFHSLIFLFGRVGRWLFGSWVFAMLALPAAADWLTYRADAARTGFTAEVLPAGLSLAWSLEAGKPESAWPRSERLSFDRAFHCVVVGESLFFGSSGDHALYRVEVATGRSRAIFMADGPIRFAPAVWKDRLFVVSDDGFLYCLTLTGEVVWKRRGGPSDVRRVGNQQLISKWPARGAPVVVGDVVYFGAGIWPTDEIFLQALDCASGEVRWMNDDSGGIYMPQPHGGADAESGVSAQGYLVATGGSNRFLPGAVGESGAPQLLVPTGRAVPACFDLADGAFRYFHLQQNGKRGGFATMAIGSMFLNSGMAFEVASGQAGATVGAGPVAAFPGGVVRAASGKVEALRWVSKEKPDRRGTLVNSWELAVEWSVELPGATALIIAGETVMVGGAGWVRRLERGTGEKTENWAVEGEVHDLAASGGRLFVSTDAGRIYGFAKTGEPTQTQLLTEGETDWPVDPEAVRAAEAILAEAGLGKGFCLDVGCGEGQLARELARRSELMVYAVDDDRERVAKLRARLLKAGLYGRRVTVHYLADLQALPHPDFFANLVVSGRSLAEGSLDFLEKGWQHSLRPYGGMAMFGAADDLQVTTRGALEGAGEWTHQYMSAANQLCSIDERVQGPLGMLWYRDVALDLPQRHGRGPAPLFYDGLLYHLGLDELVCVDAYNGTEEWRFSLPGILRAYDGDELMGVSGTGSNYCVGSTGVYVRQQGHCVRIDRRTGEELGRFDAPLQADGKPGVWGYLSLEGGQLFGSLANTGHQVTFRWKASTGDMSQQLTESATLFALDAKSGALQWRFDAKESIRNNAIAVGQGQVFLIDRPLATFDRRREAPKEELPSGDLVALDAVTGKERWRAAQQAEGTTLSLSPEYRRLLVSYQPTRFALASEVGAKLAVFSTEQGEKLWEKDAKYSSRPLINDYTVYAQGGAWDLLSGEERPFNFSRSYGCGVLAGSRHMMVYRSATLGYFDLTKNERTENYGGVRPGCWLNALPAGGLVLVPDASAGCQCSYLNQSWMALEPVALRPPEVSLPSGTYPDEVEVVLSHEDSRRGAMIRYTLDGGSPTAESALYQQPLRVATTTRVRSRVFMPDGKVSRAVDARLVIDPDLLPLADAHWRVWDVSSGKVSGGPSRWTVVEDVVRETSNIYQGAASDLAPETERYGTLRLFKEADDFRDGEIEFEMRSGDDDGIGLAFRVEDETHHYLWTTDLQRQFRVLAVKDGETYRVLASNDRAYQKNVWHQVKITLVGPLITVEVDGEEDFRVSDERFSQGTIALHNWGSSQIEFRNLRLRRTQVDGKEEVER
jgi:outer membrane protein assembly factor BamB